MIERLQLVVIQKLCLDYKWRFNSSKIQLKNGTISIIIKDKVFEISAGVYQVRERIHCKHPYPFYESEIRIKHPLCGKASYVDAVVALHEAYGDGNYTEDAEPCYIVKYLDKNKNINTFRDTSFDTDLNTAKQVFRTIKKEVFIIKDIVIKKVVFINLEMMLIEEYNGLTRLLNIKNTCVKKETIDAIIGYVPIKLPRKRKEQNNG